MMKSTEERLRQAANDGNLDHVQELLDSETDVNATNKHGNTALHLAAFLGHYNITSRFVGNGAQLNIQNTIGQTPLHLSVLRNHDNIIQLLISTGTDLDITTQYSGMTALHYGSRQGAADICHLLLENGANHHVLDTAGKQAEYYAANMATADVFRTYSNWTRRSPSIDIPFNLNLTKETTPDIVIETNPDTPIQTSPYLPATTPDETNTCTAELPKTEEEQLPQNGILNTEDSLEQVNHENATTTEQDGPQNKPKHQKSNATRTFKWSDKFKARQRVSVFDRLGKKAMGKRK